MKMFFSAGVKFTASSCEATAGPPSLSWVTLASLDELLWLWEQHQIQQNQFHPDGNKRTEQYWEQNKEKWREPSWSWWPWDTPSTSTHYPKHPHSPAAVVWYLCRTVCLLSSGPSCPSWSTSPHTPWSPRPPWKRRHSVSPTVRQSDVEQVKWHTSALTRVWAQHRGCCWPGRLWWRHTRTCPGDRGHS